MRAPFILFKRQTQSGLIWYAKFWDEDQLQYSSYRSTGIPARGRDGGKLEALLAAGEMAKEAASQAGKAPDILFLEYVSAFWRPDSPYAQERALIEQKPLSLAYLKINESNLRVHIKPFQPFAGIACRQLTAALIRDWKLWAAGNGLSGRMINLSLQTMRVPIHYAIEREELQADPFQRIRNAPETHKKKGVLTQLELNSLIKAPVRDPWARLAMLLGARCGMRRGEIRGLLWEDIEEKFIIIRHNWQDEEGMKIPKSGSFGEVPIPKDVRTMLDLIKVFSEDSNPESFVLNRKWTPGVPMAASFFDECVRRELRDIGISAEEQKKRNLTFHSMRHTFVTLGRAAGISDFDIQALTRHKSKTMMDNYSHPEQVIDLAAAQEKMEKVVE